MLLSAILVAVVLMAIWRLTRGRKDPLDRDEILIIRNSADRMRREQSQPFE